MHLAPQKPISCSLAREAKTKLRYHQIVLTIKAIHEELMGDMIQGRAGRQIFRGSRRRASQLRRSQREGRCLPLFFPSWQDLLGVSGSEWDSAIMSRF